MTGNQLQWLTTLVGNSKGLEGGFQNLVNAPSVKHKNKGKEENVDTLFVLVHCHRQDIPLYRVSSALLVGKASIYGLDMQITVSWRCWSRLWHIHTHICFSKMGEKPPHMQCRIRYYGCTTNTVRPKGSTSLLLFYFFKRETSNTCKSRDRATMSCGVPIPPNRRPLSLCTHPPRPSTPLDYSGANPRHIMSPANISVGLPVSLPTPPSA